MVSREAEADAAVVRAAAVAPGVALADSADVEDDFSIEYPSSDGEPMVESKRQYVPLTDTIASLEIHYQGRDDIFIGGNMMVYYRKNDNETRVAPDVFVVFGAAGSQARDSWIVWRERRAPGFVLEIASRSTWGWDAGGKRRIYAEVGVGEYWRFDPTGECFTPPLVGERLSGGEYRGIPLHGDGAGMIWGRSEALGLDICALPGPELRLYDPAAGRWLLTPQETEAALRESEAARQETEARWVSAEAARRESDVALRESEVARRESEAARQALEAENQRLMERLRILESGQ